MIDISSIREHQHAPKIKRQSIPQHGSPRFAETTIGYVRIDNWELRHADGKIHMFLAIDRVSKFTFVEFYDKAGKVNAAPSCSMPSRPSPTRSTPCSPTKRSPSPT